MVLMAIQKMANCNHEIVLKHGRYQSCLCKRIKREIEKEDLMEIGYQKYDFIYVLEALKWSFLKRDRIYL